MDSRRFSLSLATRVTLGAMILIALFAGAIGFSIAEFNRRAYLADQSAFLHNTLERNATQLALSIESLRRDTLLLSRTPPVQGIVRATRNAGFDAQEGVTLAFWEQRLPELFSLFAEANPSYFQVRLIGAADGGREFVRVERQGDRAIVAPRGDLQRKGDRNYFLATAKLNAGEIHLSEISLNQERGKIQTPYVRTIRAATPVFASDGKLFGMVVINLDIGPWIDAATADLPPGVEGFLMNSAGDYLAHPDPGRAFGFDLGQRHTWQEDMPGLQFPSGAAPGQRSLQAVPTRGGLLHVAVERVHFDPGAGDRFLLLAYALPDTVVDAWAAGARRMAGLATTGFALLLGAGVFAYLRRAFAPLIRLTGLAESIGAGSYDVALPEEGVGEMGSFVRAFGNMLDRVRARELEVRNSEERFRGTLDNMLEGCQIIAFDWRYLYVNESAATHARRRRDELVGRTMIEVYPGIEHTEVFGVLNRCMVDRIAHRTENEFRYPDDSIAWFDVSIHPSPEGLFVVSYDITERKHAENKIRMQLEHLNLLDRITRSIGERLDLQSIFQVVVRTLEDSMPVDFCCIGLHDQTSNALRIARVGVKSEALARELTLGEHTSVGVDDNGLGRCMQGQLVYEPDVTQVRFPFPERLSRGGLRSVVMAPLRSESRVFGVLVAARRETLGFVSVECEFLRQVSEHVALAAGQAQLHGALQQAYDDLRQTQQVAMQQERLRALGQMASGIAHDINNAISPVSLYTESLLENEPNLSDRARGYLETIQRAIGDVAHTVARMREFYRQREPQLTLSTVDVNQLAQQVVDLTRARWSDMPQRQGIVVGMETDLAPDLPTIMGSESEIREALINLVFNAVDAMPEGGTLTLRTTVTAGAPDPEGEPPLRRVQIEVTDTGAGMDEDTRVRCLEPFFTTKGERGTGLGLAMVYGVVKRHSAELEIESVRGKGTVIRLSFPVPTTTISDSSRLVKGAAVPSRLRILVVDDDPLLLKSLRDTLETDGHIVFAANGGQAGIDAFLAAQQRGDTFAAVITDLGMPHVDGRSVARAVKAASQSTPVILLTGWGQRLVANGDVPAHVNRVLNKPPKLQELRQALAQCFPPRES